MTYLKGRDIAKWNNDQLEMRKDLPNLYISMKQAANGNPYNLELQFMMKRKLEVWKIDGRPQNAVHEYIVFMDKKLNHLLITLKQKYCESKGNTMSAHYNGSKLGVKASMKIFDAWEIESWLTNYIMSFPNGFVDVNESISVSLPTLEKFVGETESHTYNKLINYINSSFEKQIIIPKLNQDKHVKRLVKDGRVHNIKNDIELVSFEDIITPQKNDSSGEDTEISFYELMRNEPSKHTYGRQETSNFVFENYKDIMTQDQLDKFNTILKAVEMGEVNINELFHSVIENKLKLEAIGEILFPGKSNNYWQPAVRNMLKSMRSRMDKELGRRGLTKVELRSDYAPFPNLPASENRKYREYQIDKKYLIKDFDFELNELYADVPTYKNEQVINIENIEKVHNGELTVSDLIKKYEIHKLVAVSKNGALSFYKPSADGNVIIDPDEKVKLFDCHCKGLLERVFNGYIKFNEVDGWMIPVNTDKLNPLTVKEYNILKHGSLMFLYQDNQKVVMDIIKKRINLIKFNIGSHHELLDHTYLVSNDREYKYINQTNVKSILNIK
ncbi:hypothetical protein [Mesobacillus sp. S13]|uniref:hypothetical protein n=1 Tax=Mesobacillus sp. S13 TaxID=2880221 RepID=UPI001CF0DD3B|nr:hypothetical protein [Mesobacillus sp. S13]